MIQAFANGRNAFVARADFDADGALSHARQHFIHIQNCREQTVRHGVAFEPAFGVTRKFRRLMPAEREDCGVQFRMIGNLLHARGDIAANFYDVEVGPLREQLFLAPRAAGGDGRAVWKIFQRGVRLETAKRAHARRPFGCLIPQKIGIAIN